MPFHRKRMLAPIVSTKHYVAKTNTLVSTVSGLTLVDAIARGTVRTATFQVDEGAIIKAVHLEYWLNGHGATDDSSFTFVVYKLPNGAPDPVAADMANLQSYSNKKNILFTTQGNIASAGNSSIPIIREWVKIPKGKQRFGLEDKFKAFLSVVGDDISICGMAIYKEYV